MNVRPSAIAGSWYTADPRALTAEIDGYLTKARAAQSAHYNPRAILMPHAGYRYSGETAAYSAIHVDPNVVKRVILLGPSHHARFPGLSIASVDAYETPLGQVLLDAEAVGQLRSDPLVHAFDRAHVREHSLEIELPFLQRIYARGGTNPQFASFKIIPILVGVLSEDEVQHAGALIRSLMTPDTLLLISGDFTHYGPNYRYVPFSPVDAPKRLAELDLGAFKHLEMYDQPALAQDYETMTACAMGPLKVAVAAMKQGPAPKLLRYKTSGELTGDFENSVSYLAIAWPKDNSSTLQNDQPAPAVQASATTQQSAMLTTNELKELHDLALFALRLSVEEGPSALRKANAISVTKKADEPHGAFVTLKKNGDLRGCIGFIQAYDRPLKDAIIQNAMNAALRDPRFMPVTADELSSLSVEISVLSDLVPVAGPQDIQLGTHGIYITKEGHSAVFLPEVPTEQGWTLEQTLQHLSLKARLPKDAWRSGTTFQIFTSQIYEAPYRAVDLH